MVLQSYASIYLHGEGQGYRDFKEHNEFENHYIAIIFSNLIGKFHRICSHMKSLNYQILER